LVDVLTIEMISIVVAAISVVIGVINSIIVSRRAAKTAQTTLETRQAQFFMQIFEQFHEPEFYNKLADFLTWNWKDYDDYMKKYGPEKNPKAWYSSGSVAAFFEGIGVLVYQNLIDVDLVGELMSRHVIRFWEKMEPISKEMRRRFNLPRIDEKIEYLYNEMVKREQRLQP
jgi:hypothetical protein